MEQWMIERENGLLRERNTVKKSVERNRLTEGEKDGKIETLKRGRERKDQLTKQKETEKVRQKKQRVTEQDEEEEETHLATGG